MYCEDRSFYRVYRPTHITTMNIFNLLRTACRTGWHSRNQKVVTMSAMACMVLLLVSFGIFGITLPETNFGKLDIEPLIVLLPVALRYLMALFSALCCLFFFGLPAVTWNAVESKRVVFFSRFIARIVGAGMLGLLLCFITSLPGMVLLAFTFHPSVPVVFRLAALACMVASALLFSSYPTWRMLATVHNDTMRLPRFFHFVRKCAVRFLLLGISFGVCSMLCAFALKMLLGATAVRFIIMQMAFIFMTQINALAMFTLYRDYRARYQ